jgi:hypothetical protein
MNPVTALLSTINSDLSACCVCVCVCVRARDGNWLGGRGWVVTVGTTSKCSVQVTTGNPCNVTRCSVTILEIRGLPADHCGTMQGVVSNEGNIHEQQVWNTISCCD